QLSAMELGRDGAGSAIDVGEIRTMLILEGGGDRHDESIGRGRLLLCGEPASGDRTGDHRFQPFLDEGNRAAVDGRDCRVLQIDPDDALAGLGEYGGGGQADVSEADDGDGLKEVLRSHV